MLVQTTGEAMFAGDIKLVGMHHAALVTSTRPHARLLSVDASDALQVSPPPPPPPPPGGPVLGTQFTLFLYLYRTDFQPSIQAEG